jgi:hypothetical protein
VLSPPCIRQRANRRTARRGTADCVVGARLRAEGGAGDESPYCFGVPEVVPRVPAVNVIRHASALHRRGCYRMGCSFPAHCRKSTMQRSCLHDPGLNRLSTRKPWEVGATLSRTCRTTEAQKLMKPGAFSFFNFPASGRPDHPRPRTAALASSLEGGTQVESVHRCAFSQKAARGRSKRIIVEV